MFPRTHSRARGFQSHLPVISRHHAADSLSAPGGGEGRGEVEDSRALADAHLTLPRLRRGPLPLPPEGRRGKAVPPWWPLLYRPGPPRPFGRADYPVAFGQVFLI